MDWKRPLLIGVGWGLGTAVGMAVLVGGFLWYQSRPKPPKPWNAAAIKAEYDYADVEGEKNTIVFYYTLENTTNFDYRLEDGSNVSMNATLEEQKSLSPLADSGSIGYPISIPASKRIRFPVHIVLSYSEKEKPTANLQERREFHAGIEKYISTEFENLNGFDLLDQINRYEIVFPAGWKHPAKHAESH